MPTLQTLRPPTEKKESNTDHCKRSLRCSRRPPQTAPAQCQAGLMTTQDTDSDSTTAANLAQIYLNFTSDSVQRFRTQQE